MQSPRVVRSSRTLSRVVLGGLVIGVLVDVVSLVHDLSGQSLLDRYVTGEIGQADLVAWDTTFATIGLAQAVAFILTAIVWLVWQYRIVASVEPLVGDEPVKTPGRSLLWWFVPFANLVVVPRIYGDLRDKLAPGAGAIVGQWWAVYLISNIVTNAAGRFWAAIESPDAFTTGLNLWLASDALSVASAVVAARLVLRLQGGQDALLAAPQIAVNTLQNPAAAPDAG